MQKLAVVLGCVIALGGCVEAGSGGVTSAPLSMEETSSAAVAAPAFDVTDAVERARSAFFTTEDGLVAGSETHLVEILDETDAVAVTPMHDPVAALARESLAPAPGARVHTSPLAPESTRIVAEHAFVARTESIARGGSDLDAQARDVAPSHGVVEITRGAVVETIRDTRDGVEQSWRFDARPAGQDALVVRVAASGMEHVGTTQSGEHFRDAATGLGVRYGHGTWIDARGTRTAVPVRFVGSDLVLTVPADVIDASAYPAVLDPVIGPEIAMDTPVTGARGANQLQPAIASNGTDGYLVVFTDGLFGDDDIRCVRVSSTGALLDPTSSRVATLTGSQQQAAQVVWNGARYVVAWQDGRDGDWDIYGTTVSSAGVVALEDGAPLSMTAGVEEIEPALGVAGSTTLLTWSSGAFTASDVVGARLDALGARTDAVSFTIGGGAGVQDTSAVVGSASSFLVVYTDDPDAAGAGTPFIRGRRVSATGTALIDAAFFTIAANGFGPTAGWAGGTTYVAAWTGGAAGRFAVYAASIPVTGTVTPIPAVVTPSVIGRDYLNPSLAWNGSEYLMAYFDGVYDGTAGGFTELNIGARRHTSGGATSGLAIDPTTIAANVSQPRVASLGSGFFIVYTDASGESSDIRGTRVTGTTVNDPTGLLLSSGPNDQTQPVVASDGTGYLVAWTDFRAASIDAWAATLDATGAIVGAPSLLAGGASGQVPTGAAWSGSRYLLVFVENGNVRGVTVTAAGISGAPFDIAVSATLTAESAAVACSTTIQCLVAWQQYDGAAMPIDADVRASRVDASSASPTVSPSVVVVGGAGNQFSPSVAASSARFYVAWTDDRVAANTDVRGTRFLASPLEAGGTVIGGAAGTQYASAVASDGTDFLVVFVDQRAGGTRPNDIYAQRVAGGTGALTGTALLVAGGADDELEPSVAFSGRYLVAYSRLNDTTLSVEGVRVATAGTLVDSTPLVLSDAATVSDLPRLAAAATGHWLVTYRSFVSGAARTRARTIGDDLAVGATCGAAGECGSGFCVDGVCCMTDCAGGTADCNACSVAAGAAANGTCGPITGCGDAGTTTTDAGTEDAGTTGEDSGTTGEDSGTTGTDAGTPGTDSGMTGGDGGPVRTDAGATGTDAGTVTPPRAAGGCACTVPVQSGSGTGALAVLAMLGAAIVVRRRR
jgi:MYXO-CTERM domain-containing protein